ncbi:MAG TPA: adenylate/guanylate cyclase domain-containing protein [Candidatus Limnocylindria bacterium]|nr:adenylate/guanylate cyclase domain-containing protein [Candidatus Limnocylindria bacterium]
MAPETRYARRGAIHVAYQITGSGSLDLVLISLWFSHLEARWDVPGFDHLLNRLGSFTRLISFDKYGVGLSDPAPAGSLPPLEEWMDDVRAVMDAAGSKRAALLGAGDGGMMAATFAATYPERVSALVLANSTARMSTAPDYAIGISPERVEMLERITEQTWGRADIVTLTNPSLANDDVGRDAFARLLRMAASPATALAVVRLLLQIDVRHVLSAIQAPTLVIHRTDNVLLSVENGRFLADHIPTARFVEIPGADYGLGVGDVDAMVDEVEEFLTGVRGHIDTDRMLATVLFTDIVSSTERAAAVGDSRWAQMLDAHHDVARRQISRYQGRLVKSTGDGLLATFDGPARAIQAATAIRDAAHRLGLEIRAGLHTGEIERHGDDVIGLGVHIAARVLAMAEPGEVLVSRTVRDLVAGSGIGFTDRGTHRLKGVPDEWQLFGTDA